MSPIVTLCSLLTCLVLGGQPDLNSPFLNALSQVPADTFALEPHAEITFADVSAGLGMRGLEVPVSWAALPDGAELQLLLAALPGGLAPSLVQYVIIAGPEYPEVLGLDFFDISSTVTFGYPPSHGIAFIGEFDPEAITAAFGARGYEVTRSAGHGSLLCPAAGCDTGAHADILNRMPANAFGGDLGRSFPVWANDRLVAGSPAIEVVETIAAVGNGDHRSMADYAEVHALAAVLDAHAHVATVTVVHPFRTAVPDMAHLVAGDAAPEDAFETLLSAMGTHVLPPYALLAFASVADGESESGLALLVYGDEDQATTAAAVIDARLDAFQSAVSGGSYRELYEQSGELQPSRVISDGATGLHTVVLRLEAPLPGGPEPAGANAVRVGLPYMRLFGAVQQNDFLWLVPGGGSP